MRSIIALALRATAVCATLNMQFLRPGLIQSLRDNNQVGDDPAERLQKRQGAPSIFLNNNTKKFAVNGSAIPNVHFDVGESYAGLLPIGDANDTNQLYFWFFPSTNPVAKKEIMIWLTGGPGCSSTGELMQENGPFLWQPGVFAPVPNKWSWHTLTNVVWVDQPIGSGFSQGTVTARNEQDVAKQFLGFWKNFVNTFAMQGYKVYVTGSSYSGMYCPYIASAMLDANDKQYFNVTGMQVFDGLFSGQVLQEDIPVVALTQKYAQNFALNDTTKASLQQAASKCGYTDYLKKYLVFPPAGRQPTPGSLPGQISEGIYKDGCSVFNDVVSAASQVDPCFSLYEVSNRCPTIYDPIGFSAGTMFNPAAAGPVFFNRQDVKKAINAPLDKTWEFCATPPVFVDNVDDSLSAGPGSLPVLPNVIEKTQNVIIGHGSQDMVLIADGTLLAIQNLTWGGKMGFQQTPSAPLYIPYHDNQIVESMAGAGVLGTVHTERGLTYLGVAPAGHFLSMDTPAVAYRSLEVLLGRISGFQATVPFTTDVNRTVQSTQAMGQGIVREGFAAEEMEFGDQDISAGAGTGANTVKAKKNAAAVNGMHMSYFVGVVAIMAVNMLV